LRRAVKAGITAVSPTHWTNALAPLQRFLPIERRVPHIGDKLHKGAEVLGVRSQDELYRSLVSHWARTDEIVLGGAEPATLLTSDRFVDVSGIERMMALDTVTYLPDDILVKVDRAAMSVSLETRVPMLDHKVIEFAWKLPIEYKLRETTSKWVLRQLLYRYVPRRLVERPKMGFGVPLDLWLRSSLKDWAEALLDEGRLRREGFFNPSVIRRKWDEHLSGRRNWQYHLWDVLMFQAWLEAQSG
jgi:asparagine synthase (glutamine-hydrolysing)